jgi:hypothetical protein
VVPGILGVCCFRSITYAQPLYICVRSVRHPRAITEYYLGRIGFGPTVILSFNVGCPSCSSIDTSNNCFFTSRNYVCRVIDAILQLEVAEDCHDRLLESVIETFASDSEFWKAFPEQVVELGFMSRLKSSGRFLELLIQHSDDSRASQFRHLARDQLVLITNNLVKYLPPLAAATSRRFLSTMKPKSVKNFLQKFIAEVLNGAESEKNSESFSIFVERVSSDFKMSFDSENIRPAAAGNFYHFKVIFDLYKNSSDRDENFLIKNILVRCVEIIPDLLKEFSQNLDNEDLKSTLMNFCRLTINIVQEFDVAKLKKKLDDVAWQNFVRACLKHGLKLKLPFAVNVLSALCRAIYGKDDSVEVSQIYDMVCGHSSFVDIVLSTSTKSIDVESKTAVLNLILTLIRCRTTLIR